MSGSGSSYAVQRFPRPARRARGRVAMERRDVLIEQVGGKEARRMVRCSPVSVGIITVRKKLVNNETTGYDGYNEGIHLQEVLQDEEEEVGVD